MFFLGVHRRRRFRPLPRGTGARTETSAGGEEEDPADGPWNNQSSRLTRGNAGLAERKRVPPTS